MKDIIVQVLPQVLTYVITAIAGVVAVEWKKHNTKILALKVSQRKRPRIF